MDRAGFTDWLERYARACQENDGAAGAALFADHAEYYPSPFAVPWRGRLEIEANWPDEPGLLNGFACELEPVALEGEVGVARWWARYGDGAEFSSVFLLRFDGDGACTEFTEWYVSRPPESA